MARGLDHVAHAVRDLDAAGELYGRLGFTVGARNRHPWGTHNRIVQLPGFFVEILTVAEPEKLIGDGFPVLFGGFTRDWLARREGLNLLLLESGDATADASDFARAGIAGSGALRFEREGRKPDGSPAKVAFSVAFARHGSATDAGFAVCQQHVPESFWNPAFQNHPNTASEIAGVVLVADEPQAHAAFLSAFCGAPHELRNGGIAVRLPRGEAEIVTPAAFAARFGEHPAGSDGLSIAAMRFFARDMDAAVRRIGEGGIALRRERSHTVVPSAAAMGATLVFESPA